MKRLVVTSRGMLEIDVDVHSRMGLAATITVFDDDCWETKSKTWMGRYSDSTLAEYLASFVDLPPDEAQTLAQQLEGPWLDEWRRRGGEDERRMVGRLLVRFGAVIAIVLVFAITGIAFIVWLLVN